MEASKFVNQSDLQSKVLKRLQFVFGEQVASSLTERVMELVNSYSGTIEPIQAPRWSEKDMIVITYGDCVRSDTERPISALASFFRDYGLEGTISSIHFLPFYPYTSDDGFSVVDYKKVDPACGSWDDIEDVRKRYRLMFDFVINHISKSSDWFLAYRQGEEPFTKFFIEKVEGVDYSQVLRPRVTPLFHPFETSRGVKEVWTTFSEDQVDLNFSEPECLLAMLEVLFFYLKKGAHFIRLDAVNYLWKELGTKCTHLPEAHELVKLMRDLTDYLAPNATIISETNVPHDENQSYFGNGDEVHMIYNFSLPPLLLDSLINEDAQYLTEWAKSVSVTLEGTTFFNFAASHDGIGVRSFISFVEEGRIPAERLDKMLATVTARGGGISKRTKPDGSQSPYELNISYFDAIRDPDLSFNLQVKAFLATRSILLALRGVPGIYFHSIIGTQNYHHGVRETGRWRTINRRKYDRKELNEVLAHEPHRSIFAGMKRLMETRVAEPAFHPEGYQEVLEVGENRVFVIRRGEENPVFCLTNVSRDKLEISLPITGQYRELISGNLENLAGSIKLEPFQAKWLKAV
jgi:glucosylglycerate phosphorylase